MKEPVFKELLHQIEEIIQKIVVRIIDHTEADNTPMKEEDHPMKEGIPTEIEDLQEEEDHKTMGDPQRDMEDPLTMEGQLIKMEDHQDTLIEEDPRT